MEAVRKELADEGQWPSLLLLATTRAPTSHPLDLAWTEPDNFVVNLCELVNYSDKVISNNWPPVMTTENH